MIEVVEPQISDLRVVCRARVFFGHQSVGSNILRGIEPVYATAGETAPRIVESGQPPSDDAFLAHAKVGKNRDPLSKLADFNAIVEELGDQVDVAMVKFCYADITASSDVKALFQAYVAMVHVLQSRHPRLRFVHTTVPLTTDRSGKAKIKALLGRDDQRGPADNLAREQYNSMVRDSYGGGAQLFDIAAVEATTDQQPMVRKLNGQPYRVLNRELSADAGHLNDLGSKVAAAELIRVLAAGTAGP